MNLNLIIRYVLPVAVGALIWASPIPDGVSIDAWHILAMMTATIVGIVSMPLNIGCVAFIGLTATMLTGTLSPSVALDGFSRPLLWLIVMAFIFSRAFIKTGLGNRLSLWVLSRIGDSSLKVAYGLVFSGAILSAGIPSATARSGGVIYPILRSICSALGSEPDKNPNKIGRYLTQTYFQSEAFISYLFPTGITCNVLIIEFAKKIADIDITWVSWTLGASALVLVSGILVPYVMYLIIPPDMKKSPEAKSAAKRLLGELGPMGRSEKSLAAIFAITIALFVASDYIGISATLVALLAVSAMLLAGVITWDDVLSEKSSWNTLIWMGTLICMASALADKGFMTWVGSAVGSHIAGMNWILVTFLVCLFFNYSQYAFASLTARTVAFYGVCLTALLSVGCPAVVAILALAHLGNTSACLTQYTSGFAPVFYGAGYFTAKEWWKIGFAVSWLHFAIVMILGPIWWKVIGFW